MRFGEVSVSNFKSFENITFKLEKFNILIGANASGKSNFIHIFKFLQDVIFFGLDNAISLQGGPEYLTNAKIGTSTNVHFRYEFVFEDSDNAKLSNSKNNQLIKIDKVVHEFEIAFKKRGSSYKLVYDKLYLNYKCSNISTDSTEKGKTTIETEIGEMNITITKRPKEFKIDLDKPNTFEFKIEELIPSVFRKIIKQSGDLLIQHIIFFMPPRFDSFISNLAIYDFDPKLIKKPSSINGKNDLEEDGSNLSIVIKKIVENKNKKRLFSNLIKELLPFVDDINVEKFVDKSILFKLRECYSSNTYFPSSLMSDGTVNITALIVALFFQDKPFVILEEPERNIHPYLISKLVNMMNDAAENKQIIVTTHNPEIVRNADINNIYLISRDKEGFSRITKPAANEDLKIFMQNDIGISDLYIQNLLEVKNYV